MPQPDPWPDSHSTLSFDRQAGAGPAEPEPQASPEGTDPGLPTSVSAVGTPVIPGYIVMAEIARGGMGRVYAAIDLALDREVAIKTLLPRASAERFITEAKITAKLPHPSIPPVHALGNGTDGTPWLAMKLIHGQTLAELLAGRECGRPDRPRFLQIFEQIAQAVGFAHSRGIIHRDLKPQNVMVGEFGEVQVMDWGLAKDLSAESDRQRESAADGSDPDGSGRRFGQGDSGHTETGAVLGTPSYMAPEQARGEPVDARADVFALGSILAAILTGKPAFVGSTADETICKAAGADLAEAYERLAGCGADAELVQLALRCLAARPEDRFADGREVAAAVASYRAALEARLRRAETAAAEAAVREAEQRKRRRQARLAIGVVAAVLLAGLAASLWQMGRAMTAEEEARQSEQRAMANAELARQSEQRAVANAQQERVAKLLAEAEKQRAIAFRDQALDALRATTGTDIEKFLGAKKELTAQDRAYLEAIVRRWQELARQEGTDQESRAIAAEGYFRVGLLWQRLGRREEARAEYERAVALQERLVTDFPAVPGYRRDLAASHLNLGGLLLYLGQRTKAEEHYRKALALWEELAAQFPAAAELFRDLANCHNNLAILLAEAGKRAEAAEHYRKGLTIWEKLVTAFPDNPDYRSCWAGLHANLGLLLAETGQWAEAAEHYRTGLAFQEKLVAEFPGVPDFRRDLATSHTQLGNVLKEAGQPAEAEKHYRTGLALQEKLVAEFPGVPDHRCDPARSHNNLALLLVNLGQSDGAEQHHRKGLAIWEKLVAEFPTIPGYRLSLATSYSNLSLLLYNSGRPAEAEEQFRKALAIREKLVAEFPAVLGYRTDFAGGCCNLGHRLRAGGRAADSLAWYDKAVATLSPIQRAGSADETVKSILRSSHAGRATAHDQLGKFDEAVKDWDRVIELSPPAEQPPFRVTRAISRLKAGQVAEAVAEVAELTKLPDPPAPVLYDFACVYAVASDQIADKKQEYADRALELLQRAVKAGFKDVAHMKVDKALDPLRERKDFQKLLAELEKKFPPPPKDDL